MATKKSTNKPVTAYKAFDKDFSCRGFKFEVGKTYKHEGDVVICRSGFHACVNPLDVWSYYDLIDTRFAEVELSGEQVTHDEDSKIAAAEITIRAEITLPEFIRNGVAKFIELVAPGAKKKEEAASGYYAQLAASGNSAQLAASGDSAQLAASGDSAKLAASGDSAKLAASGYYAKLAASGYYAQLAASGYYAQLAASGDSAQLAASGDYAQLAASGYYAQLAASGNSAQLAASGDSAQLAASGDYAKLAASGNSAQLEVTGKNGVIASASINGRAKGAVGAWISLAEFNDKNECVGFAVGCIGQDGLEPDSWYRANGGKLVKVED